jgi:hypothetical protein
MEYSVNCFIKCGYGPWDGNERLGGWSLIIDFIIISAFYYTTLFLLVYIFLISSAEYFYGNEVEEAYGLFVEG